jgi:hypothetical protein
MSGGSLVLLVCLYIAYVKGMEDVFTPLHVKYLSAGTASGEALEFESLKPGESIVVAQTFFADIGESHGREFFLIGGMEPEISARNCSLVWQRDGTAELTPNSPVRSRRLTAAELEGLQISRQILRRRDTNFGTAMTAYLFEYFRGDKKIGEERFADGSQVLDETSELRLQTPPSVFLNEEFEKISSDGHFSRTMVEKLVTFDMIERSLRHTP